MRLSQICQSSEAVEEIKRQTSEAIPLEVPETTGEAIETAGSKGS